MDGESEAFPSYFPGIAGASFGLTKRELFASMALQGSLTRGPLSDEDGEEAVRAADALIEALSK